MKITIKMKIQFTQTHFPLSIIVIAEFHYKLGEENFPETENTMKQFKNYTGFLRR